MAGDVDELTFADVEIHVFQRMRMGAGVGLGDLLEPDHLSVMLLRTGVTFVKAAGRIVMHDVPRRPQPAYSRRPQPAYSRRLRLPLREIGRASCRERAETSVLHGA